MANNAPLSERVARLEERMSMLEDVHTDVKALNAKMNRYEGKWGGIILVFTAIGIFFKIEWMKVKLWLFGSP